MNKIRMFREMYAVAKVKEPLESHLNKSCRHCDDFSMYGGEDFKLTDFIEHLIARHPKKLTDEEFKKYEKFCNG